MSKVLVFIMCWTVFINAQVFSDYGLKIGMGISNQDWTNDDINMNFENQKGITARIFANIVDYSYLSLLGEISYSGKGFKESVEYTTIENPGGTGVYKKFNIRLNYISLSFLGKLKYDYSIFSPYILLGPQYNYLFDKQIDQEFNVAFSDFNEHNIGISTGMGTEIRIGKINLLCEYRYERDFTNSSATAFKMLNYSHNFLTGIIF
jgi:hypothetical protein